MKPSTRRNAFFGWPSEGGIAMVKVLLLTTVLMGLATFASRGTQLELRISNNDLLARKALAIAEAGIDHGFSRIVAGLAGCPADCFDDELSNGGTGGSLVPIGSTYTDPNGNSFRSRGFGGGTYYVRAEDNRDDVPHLPEDDQDGRIKIVSRGTVGRSERIIEATIRPVPLFGDGLFGRERVRFTGGGSTDSYSGVYDPDNPGSNGHVGTNGDVDLSGNPTAINGNATAAGSVNLGTSTVTGSVEENAPPVYFPPVTACGPPYSNGTGIAGVFTLWTHGGRSGDFTVNAGQNVTLAPGNYCFKSINLNGGSSITVTGQTTISITDVSDLSGGTLVNTTQIASNLQIASSYVSTNENQGLTIAGGADAYMSVYAPDTAVKITGSSEFYGAIVGKTVWVTGDTHFHYDENLANLGFGAQIASWHEIRH